MTRTVQSSAVRILSLTLALLIVAITASRQSYDPTMRDYVEICDEMAQLAGDNFCRPNSAYSGLHYPPIHLYDTYEQVIFTQVFDICCRDRAKNKLNGDRCQLTDPTNGCQLTPEV
uniref:Bm9073 n=1 Tax=Brugia malayi TaxID=6279 RepID=A0A0J9Y6U9_BRUMA|nr:Bm9073 [Brugia malayi]